MAEINDEKRVPFFVGQFENAKVQIAWNTEFDFDLLAIVTGTNNKVVGCIYPNKLLPVDKKVGDHNKFPFVELDQDAGRHDTLALHKNVWEQGIGVNEETISVGKLDENVRYIRFFCLDYTRRKGEEGRFYESNLEVNFNINGKDVNHHSIKNTNCNIVYLAEINNSNPGKAECYARNEGILMGDVIFGWTRKAQGKNILEHFNLMYP